MVLTAERRGSWRDRPSTRPPRQAVETSFDGIAEKPTSLLSSEPEVRQL